MSKIKIRIDKDGTIIREKIEDSHSTSEINAPKKSNTFRRKIAITVLVTILAIISIAFIVYGVSKQREKSIETNNNLIEENVTQETNVIVESVTQETTVSKSEVQENISNEETTEMKTIVTYPEGLRGLGGSIFIVNLDGGNCHELTPGGGPIWSPDGKNIVFGGYSLELWVAKVDGSSITYLTTGDYPSWSPDSKYIVVTDFGNVDERGVYVISVDGGKPVKIYNENDYGPDYAIWLPNENKIFVSTYYGNILINPDGSNLIKLNGDGYLSPNGKKFLFYGGTNIITTNLDGSDLKKIVEVDIIGMDNYQWSPDGSKICYTSFTDNQSICIINSDGTNKVVISSDKNFSSEFYWAPDSSKILINIEENWEIVNSDGTNLIKIADDSKENPEFSPDSKKIAFDGYEGNTPYLYIIYSDGSKTIKLSEANGYNPQWSPDGSKIIFTR
ncbi:MAG: hypothetical protein ACYDIA_07325 [Candidatus Humimicrobiaceae bacterium]